MNREITPEAQVAASEQLPAEYPATTPEIYDPESPSTIAALDQAMGVDVNSVQESQPEVSELAEGPQAPIGELNNVKLAPAARHGFAIPGLNRLTRLRPQIHIPLPGPVANLLERIPAKMRPLLGGAIALVLAGIIFVGVHALGHHPSHETLKSVAQKTDATKVSKGQAPSSASKSITHAALPVPESVSAVKAVDARELALVKAAVPQTCALNGGKVRKWNYVDGYLLCIVKGASGISSYVLQHDETGYTYLGGGNSTLTSETITDLGVPALTAQTLTNKSY